MIEPDWSELTNDELVLLVQYAHKPIADGARSEQLRRGWYIAHACALCGAEVMMSEEFYDMDGMAVTPFYGDVQANVDREGPVCHECHRSRLVYSEADGYYVLP
jgi:hypothetical protein